MIEYGQNWETTNPDGIVVDNKDPEFMGRIRVRVAGIHDGVPNDHLPWAINGQSSGRGPSANAASVRIPAVGSRVKLNFHDDPSNPEYIGGVTTKDSIPSVFRENYPNRSGEMFPNGTHWYLDEQTDTFFFKHGGFSCTIDKSGKVTVQSGQIEIVSKDVAWNAGTYRLKSPNITNDSPSTNMTGQTNSTGMITGAGGFAVSGGEGGASATVYGSIRIRSGSVEVQGGDVNADGWGLKTHKHTGDSGGTTSPALPG